MAQAKPARAFEHIKSVSEGPEQTWELKLEPNVCYYLHDVERQHEGEQSFEVWESSDHQNHRRLALWNDHTGNVGHPEFTPTSDTVYVTADFKVQRGNDREAWKHNVRNSAECPTGDFADMSWKDRPCRCRISVK